MALQSNIRTPQFGSNMAPTLQGEANKRPNCFKMNGTGKIEEGIKLELGHPAVSGKPALFIGDYYIFSNYKNGVAFDSKGTVRRAILKQLTREGMKPLKLLTQPNGPNPPLLLHVDTNLPSGTKPKEHFWSGVDTDEDVLAWSGKETLVSFSADQSWADIFYGDGAVKRVIRQGPQLVVQQLTLEEQAERRIEQAIYNIEIAKDEQDGDRRIPREDRSLHQLIAVLAIGGTRSSVVFRQVYGLLKDFARIGDMRPRVLAHTMDVLRERFPDHVVEFEDMSLASKFGFHSSLANYDAPIRDRRSTPSERKAKLAARALRDQQTRAAMRGSSADQSLKGKSGGKKKK